MLTDRLKCPGGPVAWSGGLRPIVLPREHHRNLLSDTIQAPIEKRARAHRGGAIDSFEEVVSELLWNEGFWVWTSYKVNLIREEKLGIRRPSCARWELDIVAYHAPTNVIVSLNAIAITKLYSANKRFHPPTEGRGQSSLP